MAGLAPKLGDLLMAEYVAQKGLKPDIESLSKELVMMNAALEDASQVPPEQLTRVEKLWARNVRELSYDMEDVVDDFILRVTGGNSETATDVNVLKKILGKATAMMKKVKDRHQISNKVKDIKKLSNELAQLRAKYTIRGAGANFAASTGIDPRVLSLYKKESDLVGIEESRDKVIRMLSIRTKDDDAHADASEQILKIVSIVGVGGLGKTPLAKTVHDMLKTQFGCSAFISVGRTPNLTGIFEKMLVGLDKNYKQVDMARWDIERFGNELHEFLQHKRYFIVVDDIWDVGSWEAIRYALKDNNCGSRIIMTTRLPPKPCEDWSKVYDSIGFGNGDDNTTKILSYSYYDLPAYLKPILLHLSIFPEDYIFDTKSMIWMWIAEGFVHLEKKEGSLFEVGERYFKELVNRSMIQQIEDKGRQYFEEFRIHDIVLDLIRKLLKDEDFITILDSREQHSSLDSLSREKKTGMTRLEGMVRRLAVRNEHVRNFPEDIIDTPKALRSLNFIRCKTEILVPLHSFRLRRVLCIQFSRLPVNLKHLARLLHLKYLDISHTPIDVLPEEIGHLKSLQTLILVDTGLDELPPAVCLLTQLMCLNASGFKRFPADRMGNLTSLEQLWLERVVGRNATEDLVVALGNLTRLRLVTIVLSEGLDESLQQGLVQSLRNLQELKELYLISEGLSHQGATVLEDWEAPRQLLRLVIIGITFSRLPRWPPGYTVTVSTDSFKNLRFCRVCTTLKFHMGAMPRVEHLQFGVYAGYWSWAEYNGVPLEQFPTKDVIEDLDLGLDNLLSLEQVAVEVDCSGATAVEVQEVEAVVTRAVENHPNHPTIQMERIWEGNILSNERTVALLQQNIEPHGRVLWLKDKPDALFIADLRMYRLLQKAVISIDCAGASMYEVEKVEAALRHAAEAHRNHPIIQLIRTNTNEMVSSSDHPDTELHDDHDDSPDNSISKLQLRN
ncbi:unnamed protein product [Urochloa decumbens]|uniref:Uncharacterized protein n=1 Tax=Urochloa decumbens TaxID=240449 RepID=A0ABC8VJ98_9POAL